MTAPLVGRRSPDGPAQHRSAAAADTASVGDREPSSAAGSPMRGSLAPLMVAVGSVAALVASLPLRDNSFLTHLATGRLLLDDGLPSQNPFLYTGTDFPVPSWWWSILLAVAEDLGGAGAIRVLTAVVAGAVGVALVRLTRPPEGDLASTRLLATLVPTVAVLVTMFDFLSSRPHLIGFLLLALVVLVWHEERSPWWLLAIFAMWVNLHGTWLYGVVVLGALAVARALDDRRVRPRDLWGLGAAAAGLVAGGALYPRAFEVLLLPARQFGDPLEREALSAYQEWARVTPDRPVFWVLLAMAAVALRGCVARRRWASAALVAALTVMGLSSLRLVPVAAVTLVPFAAASLRSSGSLPLPSGRAARSVTAAGALVLLCTLGYSFTGDGYDLARYPVRAVDWLESRDLVASGDVQVVAPGFVGNYLEWRYGSDANAYVDDRPDAATLIDYRRITRLEPGWQDAFERAEPDVVLWGSDGRLIERLEGDDAWVRATEVDGFVVFCRAELATRCS